MASVLLIRVLEDAGVLPGVVNVHSLTMAIEIGVPFSRLHRRTGVNESQTKKA